MYCVFVTERFDRSLTKIGTAERRRIEAKLSGSVAMQLKQEPHFGTNIKKLRGFDPDTWRYRVGNYRIFYTIDEDAKQINLLTIDHRKDAY